MWVWYFNDVKGILVEVVLLGELNIEVVFMLICWGFEKLVIIEDVVDDVFVVIVDMNNLVELLVNINNVDI